MQSGQPATFSVGTTGATGHQWQRNNANISGATSASYTLNSTVLSDDGAAFRCIASNASGSVTSNPATPAPPPAYASTLATFNEQPANGTWSLYLLDDGPGDVGSIAGGWTLTLTTSGSSVTRSSVHLHAPRITSVTLRDQQYLHLTVSGSEASYLLETSTDLVNWSKVSTQGNALGSMMFMQAATNSAQFYRVLNVGR